MRWPGRGGEELAKKGQARVTASREEWESTTTHMGWMGHARPHPTEEREETTKALFSSHPINAKTQKRKIL